MHERRDIGRPRSRGTRALDTNLPGLPSRGGGDAESGKRSEDSGSARGSGSRAPVFSGAEILYALGAALLGAAVFEALDIGRAAPAPRADDHSSDELEIKEAEYRIHDDPKA